MNAERRKQIAKCLDALSNLKSDVQEIRDDEDSAYEGLPESIQAGEQGEKMQEAIASLDEALQSFDDIESALESAQS